MIELMARETTKRFREALSREAELIAFLKEGEDETMRNLHPDSQEALDASINESERFDAAAATWGRLTEVERKKVEKLLEKSGCPGAGYELYYDLTIRLPG